MVDAANPITPADAPANLAPANEAAANVAAANPGQVTPGTNNIGRPLTPGVVDPMNARKPGPANSNYQVTSDAGAAGSAVSPGLAATTDLAAKTDAVDANSQASPGNERRADRKAGAGVNGPTSGQVPPANIAPDAASAASPNGVDGSYAIASIARLFPGWKEGEGILLVLQAAAKMRALQDQSGEMQITASNAIRDKASADNAAASAAALKEAKDSGGSFWGDIAKVAAIVAAVVAAPETGGSSLAVVALVLTVTVAANSVAEMATGHGLVGNAAKLFGGNADTADKYGNIVICAATIAVGVIAICEGNPEVLRSGLQKAAAVTEAAGTAGAAADHYVAASHGAEARRDKAKASEGQAMIAQVDEYVQQVIQRLRRSMDAGNTIIADTVATFRQAGNATSSVKYVA